MQIIKSKDFTNTVKCEDIEAALDVTIDLNLSVSSFFYIQSATSMRLYIEAMHSTYRMREIYVLIDSTIASSFTMPQYFVKMSGDYIPGKYNLLKITVANMGGRNPIILVQNTVF